jgi:hypothetical protein
VWRDSRLVNAKIHSTLGGPCTVHAGERVATFTMAPGEIVALDEKLACSP